MNEINSLILQAVDTVVNARMAKQSKDTTIVAQIYDNAEAILGKYTIKYQNAYFDVYNNDTQTIYKKDESVYILVPLGDMGQRKFILGSAKNVKESPYVEITDPNDRYDLMGPEVSVLFKQETQFQQEYGIPGYKTEGKRVFIYTNPEIGKNKSRLLPYSNLYEYIQFAADFKYTPLEDVLKCGNYGLEIGFYISGNAVADADLDKKVDTEDLIRAYRFDTESMYGNPYEAYGYLNRAVTIHCEKGEIYDLAYIALFSEGFQSSDYRLIDNKKIEDYKDYALYSFVENRGYVLFEGERKSSLETPLYYNISEINEIFVKNIKVQFAQLRDVSNDYVAHIVTPYGTYINESQHFDGNNPCIILSPQLKQKNFILTDTTIKYYWFEENGLVHTEHELYDPLGKRGWAKMTQETLKNDSTITLKNNGELVFTAGSWISKRIKLVAVYGKDIVRTSEIVIYKSQSPAHKIAYEKDLSDQITLTVKAVGADGILSDLTNNNYSFAWEYEEMNGHIISLNSTETSISFNQKTLPQQRVYRCYIFDKNTKILLDTVEYTIVLNIEVKEDITVIFSLDNNNGGSFLYNENGYLEIEDIKDYKLDFTVYKDGKELGNSETNVYKYKWNIKGCTLETIPEGSTYHYENSMVTYLPGVLTGSGPATKEPLNCRMNKSYDHSKIENTITLEITYNDTVKYFPFTFYFSKQGDPGTNGTDIQVRVTQQSVLNYLSNTPYGKYKIEVYKNGELLTNDKFSVSYEMDERYKKNTVLFNGTNYHSSTGCVKGIFSVYANRTVTNATIEDYLYNIIKLIIKLNDDSKYQIEYVLPIQITNVDTAEFFNMDNYHIVYDSAGRKPSYPDIDIKTLYSQSNATIDSIASVAPANSIINLIYKDSIHSIKANNYYRADENRDVNILKATVNDTNTITYYIPLVATINHFSLVNINEWDGNTVVVDGDKGVVYAPQIGAGHKDLEKNTFTGVLMGEYVVDQEDKGIGLWGFSEGTSTFGFSHDGKAYIGASGQGQLLINADGTGTIQSQSYQKNNQTGMLIDFAEGSIVAPSFAFYSDEDGDQKSKFLFELGESYQSKFEIKVNDTFIFKATGKDTDNKSYYYLQSTNYKDSSSEKNGLKIDLDQGQILSEDFSIKTGDGEKGGSFNFKVGNGSTSSFKIQQYNTKDKKYDTIFNATNDSQYYLKSLNYTGSQTDEEETDISGLYIDLNDGFIKSKQFRLETDGDAYFSGKINAAGGNIGGWEIYNTTDESGNIIKYLQAGNTKLDSTGNIDAAGEIDLNGLSVRAGKLIFDGTLTGEESAEEEPADANQVSIYLKKSYDDDFDKRYDTAGAMLITAPNGFAVQSDSGGNIYFRSKGTNIYANATSTFALYKNGSAKISSTNKDGKSASIELADGVITLDPPGSLQTVAVFG